MKNIELQNTTRHFHCFSDEVKKTMESLKESSKEGELSPSKMLALCVYHLEVDHHFSGQGIWR